MGIAWLWLLVAGMLWVMCWSGRMANGQGIELTPVGGVRSTYTNNSIVNRTDIGTDGAALLCTTTYSPCCTGFQNPDTQWYFPDGSQVQNNGGLPYYRNRNTNPGTVLLHRNPQGNTTGIFRCVIPDASGVLQSMFVGIYDSGTGTPTATTLEYSGTARSLTCTSTGGPATTVTWRKDGSIITINTTYQQTQVVTNTVTGEYENVLTITQSVADIFGTYSCTVGNSRGSSAAIEAMVSLLQVAITPVANPTAGQSYTFTCTVTPQGGLTGTPTVQWMGPGSSDPITTGEDFTVSSTPSYTLTINRLRQSHDGQYTCQATIGSTTGSASATLTVQAPSVSVMITPTSTAAVGQQGYSLTCSVSGADSLSPTSTTYRWYNESSNPRSQVGTASTYTFTRLQPYHSGQYTCEVAISSPFLNADLSQSMMRSITLRIPDPVVSVLHGGGATAFAGSQLTLICNIALDSTLFFILGDLDVTPMWSGPGSGMLSSDGRITVSPASRQGVSTTFASQVVFNTLQTSDTGTYTCQATVAPRGSTAGTVTNGVGSANTATPTIQNPTIQLVLTPNITRFPNTAPYNTFSLTCTATGPQGVVSPKAFRWTRRIGADTGGLTELTDNGDSILITSVDLTQPTSTSVLTVRETAAAVYRYRCRVDFNELSIVNAIDEYPINVTSSANPVQPQNLMNMDTRHDRTMVRWSVSYIAYTPETYTVNYGLATDSLNMSATATQRGDNFAIPSQPLMFSAVLTGLSPGVTYYYRVEARNSVGTTLSAVQQFTSNELPPTPPRMFQITAVTTNSLSFSWQEPATANGEITRYELSCLPLLSDIPIPQTITPVPTARTAMLTDLNPGVRYNCSIGAGNGAGLSPLVYADSITVEIAPTGPPSSFMVTPEARHMTFSWAPPNAPERNGVITGYSLSCTPSSIPMQPYTQAGTFRLAGFTPATTYNCSIFASNSIGNGPVVSMIIRTLDDAPGTAPQSVMFEHLQDIPEMVFFSWLPPIEQNGAITRYDIVCTPSSGSGEPVNGMSDGALNDTVGMFTPATQYSCTITASTSVGTGPGITVTLPSAPENVTLAISPTGTTLPQLLVRWTIDPPNGVMLTYTIYVTRLDVGNATLIYTSIITQLDIPSDDLDPGDLDAGELVLVHVSASTSAGEGARSPGVRERTREEPPGSVGCPSRWRDLQNAIQVDWTSPQDPNGIVLRYYLALTSYAGNTVIATASVNSNSTLTTGFSARLEDGVPYIVQIFAENSAGNGTVCNVIDFTNELEPPAPSGLSVDRISDTMITAVWQPLSLVEARGHIRYRVMVTSTTASKRKRQTTPGETMCTLMSPCEVPANESSVLVGGLDPDTSYSVTVDAINSDGDIGPTSAPVIVTPASVPPTPGTSVVGIVVGIVVPLVVVIVILVIILGVVIARNRRYQLTIQEHAVNDQPVKWSAVAKSGDVDIITTQCEAYGLADIGHEYEQIPTSGMTSQPPNPEYEIPTAQCLAYVPTSQQRERVEEGVYETV